MIRAIVLLLLLGLLSACGGGGGGSTGPVISTLSFPLQDGLAKSVLAAGTIYYSVSGDCSGTASINNSVPVAATFEGGAAQSSTSTATMEFTDCLPLISSNTSTSYYDSSLTPLGTITDSDYELFLTPPTIPVSVKVGDSGTIGTQMLYTDNTKTVQDGHDVFSYSVEPDTANSAIIILMLRSYDSGGALTFIQEDRFTIVADGTMTPISTDLQFLDAPPLHLLLTALAPTVIPVSDFLGVPKLVSNDLFYTPSSNQWEMAGDDSGNVLLIVPLTVNSTEVVVAGYQKQVGSEWSTQIELGPVKSTPDPNTSSYIEPQVRFDSAGDAVAVWVDMDNTALSDRDFTSHVYVRNYDHITGWDAPIMIQSDPAEYATAVNLTVQDDGTAWIVWTERTYKDAFFAANDTFAIFAAEYTPASGWGTPEKVTGDYPDRARGRITSDNNGNPTVLWLHDLSQSEYALYSISRVSGVWGAPAVVAPAEPNTGGFVHEITDFDIVMDSSGNAIAVWTRLDPTGTFTVVYRNQYVASSGWLGVTPVPTVLSQNSFSPKLAMDDLGNAFILWVEYDGGSAYGIWAVRFDHVLGWQTPTLISSPTEIFNDSQHPQIRFDELGNAVAIWERYDSFFNTTLVRACRYDRNTGWGENKTISNGNGVVMRPQLAVAKNGHATAAWAQDDVGNLSWKVWSNDFDFN